MPQRKLPRNRPSVERIEQELDLLTGFKRGFAQPEDFEGLTGLLGLGLVFRVTGEDAHLLDRVAALRQVLNDVTDRVADKRTREMCKLLFFLDDDKDLQVSTISARRDAAERRWALGQDGFRRGPEQRARGIVAGELLCCELEASYERRGLAGQDGVIIKAVRTNEELRGVMFKLVEDATYFLGCTGSRSREAYYLESIEKRLEQRPELTHYRVLWQQPHHEVLISHIRQLIRLKSSATRRAAGSEVCIGYFDDPALEPERFVVANDHSALVVMPPASEVGNFDSAVVFTDEASVESLKRYVVDLFNCGETVDDEMLSRLKPIGRRG